MKIENFAKEDIQLIKRAMLENSVTLTSSALQCKNTMLEESYKRVMDSAKRLIFLVNVIDGFADYDK